MRVSNVLVNGFQIRTLNGSNVVQPEEVIACVSVFIKGDKVVVDGKPGEIVHTDDRDQTSVEYVVQFDDHEHSCVVVMADALSRP